MKRVFVLIALLTTTLLAGQAAKKDKIIEKKKGSITFVVDEGLEPIEGKRILVDGKKLAKQILSPYEFPGELNIVATSFADERNLRYIGNLKDMFFRTVVKAYANHQSLVLSPDMIWLLISQGFARYVNAHPEELRPQLVEHDGKMDLVVRTPEELLTGNPDWEKIMGDFSDSIQKYTKGDIAKTITANFTTTTPVTRIASEITLMESVKSYFEYVVMYLACGIPSVTLQGTPEDWQLVLDKAKRLKPYGLTKWIEELEPILTEFVRTAKGKPDQLFWQRMVKEVRLPRLKGGGCSADKPTELDGWVLKLFPNEQGVTLDKIPHTQNMPADHVRVDFKYLIVAPGTGEVLRETPMELWAGFIGSEEDTIANALIPKIGWLVRIDDEESTLSDLHKTNEKGTIHLRIKEVPTVLAQLGRIKRLKLDFTGKVVLPTWVDKLTIENFTISGKMTEEEKAEIQKRFPKAVINSAWADELTIEDLKIFSKTTEGLEKLTIEDLTIPGKIRQKIKNGFP